MQKEEYTRIIGQCQGSEKGPLLVIFCQIHGNEPAGYRAVQEFFAAVEAEYLKKPGFDFRGKILALRGNLEAAKRGQRYIDKDLNRSWTDANVAKVLTAEPESLDNEDQQIRESLLLIRKEVAEYKPTEIVVLDLHSTTAHGGLFVIPAPSELSRQIGLSLHAPVLHGFLDGLQGTTLHYFRQGCFGATPTTAVCFEAGQHEASSSTSHCVSAIIRCFTAMGGFRPEDIESKHEDLLRRNAAGLPKEGELLYHHEIKPGDAFRMREDKIYRNFDPVKKGELLAFDRHGSIYSPADAFMLMPLYQSQGNDGFFLIKELSPASGEDNKLQLDMQAPEPLF